MNKIRSIQPESLRLPHYGTPCALCPRAMRDVLTRIGLRRMQTGNFTVEELHE